LSQGDLIINGSSVAPVVEPYLCFGFKIAEAVVYISDVSYIPEETWSMLLQPGRLRSVPVFIIDCLRLQPHTSHFGVKDSINAVRRMGAQRSYLTGFGHEVSHEEYLTILQRAGSGEEADVHDAQYSATVLKALQLIDKGKSFWARPAFDGLRIIVSGDGSVTDDAY
jgi:phosphoribosyl 1,2-cyclic phosphodiesterase